MATPRRAGHTREAILGILRRGGARSVEDLAGELGLAGATVRRHLDVLLRDGLAAVAQERGRAGRPRYAFSLTEAGADALGHHYVRITRRLLYEIAALAPEETAGLDGAGLAALVFRKLAARLADEYAPRVAGVTPAERARSAARLLEDEGFDFEVVEDGGGLELLGRGCPCLRLREALDAAADAACGHDRELLAALIGARVERREGDALPPGFACAYAVLDA